MDNSEKLLIPGFAGYLYPEELTFIKSELRKSSSLRRQWGFRPSAKQLNEDYIRYVARLYSVCSYVWGTERQEVSFSFAAKNKKR
jgi:hypothetical protein